MTRIDEATREKILELYARGRSRNQIASELDLSGSTVTRACNDAGLSFNRERTELAVRAAKVDLDEERILIAKMLVVAAQDMLDLINAPYLVWRFGGKDNVYNEHLLDSMPMDARLAVMQSAAIAFDRATRIVENGSHGLDEALGVLGAFETMMKMAVSQWQQEESKDKDDDEGGTDDRRSEQAEQAGNEGGGSHARRPSS